LRLKKLITLVQQPVKQKSNSLASPKSLTPKKTGTILDIEPLELARQLTLIEELTVSRISLNELMMWSKDSNNNKTSPNVHNYNFWQNKLIDWIRLEILLKFKIKRRVKIIRYIVDLIRHLLELKNFNSVIHIGTLLTSTPISNLKKTIDHLKKEFIEVEKLLTTAKNNQSDIISPVVPYLSPILSHFVESHRVPVSYNGKINWQRLQMDANYLLNFRASIKEKYSIANVETVKIFIKQRMDISIPKSDFDNLVNLTTNADSTGVTPVGEIIPNSISKLVTKFSARNFKT